MEGNKNPDQIVAAACPTCGKMLDDAVKVEEMGAPSKANISKLDNPARVTANHRHGTEPCV